MFDSIATKPLSRRFPCRLWFGRCRSGLTAFCTLLAACLLASAAKGAGYVPYGLDASTLHLWHLNDTGVPAVDAVNGAKNLPMKGLFGGAAFDSTTALTGFGSSLLVNSGTSTSGILLAAAALANGSGDDVAFSHADPVTGAFTYEAVIKFNSTYSPTTDTTGRAMQIVSMDNDDPLTRIFQFKYVGRAGSQSPPQLQFINIAGGVQTLAVTVPTSGTNRVDNVSWFHVAVTYTGSPGTTGNVSFYWTKLPTAGGTTTANLLGTGTMTYSLTVASGDFAIGNEARTTGGETDGFAGWIDEVRISSIARTATAMMPSNYDTDGDGLPDAWETKYFGNLTSTATSDPDGDGFTNAQEYAAGSNPTLKASTPQDTDADGLPDAWELQYFGSLAYGASDDPDGDGYTNAQEYAAGTDPTNASSNPGDSDGDGLPDAWELLHFGTLAYGPNDDPDGDGFTNAQEYAANTDPLDASYYPAGPKAKYVQIDDGDSTTSEYGYAADDINSVAYICNGLRTVGNQQFLTYYGRHQTDSTYAYNNTLWVARRTVGAKVWEIFRTTFTANDITDDHDTIAFGIDGEGYMHLSWGMHNGNGTSFHYAKSTTSVTGTNPIAFGADLHNMTGSETIVTYPQFLMMPNGDLLYLYRVGDPATGGSGSGDTYMNRYSLATHAWTNVNAVSGVGKPFIKGIGWSPDYNAYPNMPCVDATGNIFLTWPWRFTPDYQTNQDEAFAKSTDYGVTWQRSTNTTYTLPISRIGENGNANTASETILSIAQGSSLINQSGMCLDDQGQPVMATWWAPGTASGNYRRQYMVAFPGTAGSAWQTRQVSNRTVDATTSKISATYARDLSRPVVVCDKAGRILVLYRDNQDYNGLTVAYSQSRAADPTRSNWTTLTLTTDSLGALEPVIDLARWQQDNVLQVIYQPSTYTPLSGTAYNAPTNNASPIGVFEWDAAAYFAPPRLNVSRGTQDAVLSWNSILGNSYRLWTSTDLVNWTMLDTFTGADRTALSYTHVGGATGTKRFWRLEVKEGTF